MRQSRFYVASKLQFGNLELKPQTAHYMSNVLRLKLYDQVILFDGSGFEFAANIINIQKNKVLVEIVEKHPLNNESNLNIHLGQVISRGEKMDLIIQKSCELGVSQITPLFSSRCEVKLNADRLAKKIAHWQQISVSAAEQCKRSVLPVINSAQNIDEWLQQRTEEVKMILHPQGTNLKQIKPMQSLALLVGCEGGFADHEVNLAKHHQFTDINLGNRILRTETAPIAMLAIAQHLWGDI